MLSPTLLPTSRRKFPNAGRGHDMPSPKDIVQIIERIDAVSLTCADKREDASRPSSSSFASCEEPIVPSHGNRPDLLLNSDVSKLKLPVSEKQHKRVPLAQRIVDRLAKR